VCARLQTVADTCVATAAMQTIRTRQVQQQQQQRQQQQHLQQQQHPHVWQQRQWLLLASVLMLTLFTRTIQGITEELSPGKCVSKCDYKKQMLSTSCYCELQSLQQWVRAQAHLPIHCCTIIITVPVKTCFTPDWPTLAGKQTVHDKHHIANTLLTMYFVQWSRKWVSREAFFWYFFNIIYRILQRIQRGLSKQSQQSSNQLLTCFPCYQQN